MFALPLALALALASETAAPAMPPLPHRIRVEGLRAVERARYTFTLDATKPFDEAYPIALFETLATKQEKEERLLRREFGISVTRDVLEKEFARIEKETLAPDQWEAIKKALANDHERLLQVFCRSQAVSRVLHRRFAFDPKIHARNHQRAREARAALLATKAPPGTRVLVIARKAGEAPSTTEMVGRARAEAALPHVLTSPEHADPANTADASKPVALDPELTHVLEKQLQKPGDVTKILEEAERFSVFRLLTVTETGWTVQAFSVPKKGFESWFAARR